MIQLGLSLQVLLSQVFIVNLLKQKGFFEFIEFNNNAENVLESLC